MEEVCPHFYFRKFFKEKEIANMRNKTGKKKENRISGFGRKILVPSFAGAVYNEQLKAENALEWTGRLGNIRTCARGIVNKEIIFV